MKTVIEMARGVKATAYTNRHYPDRTTYTFGPEQLEAFAELVRADERTANIGCIGRIAAMVVDPIDQARLYEAMDAIRARRTHEQLALVDVPDRLCPHCRVCVGYLE